MRCGIEFCHSCSRCVCASCGGGVEEEEELWTCSRCTEEHQLDWFDSYDEDHET